MTDQRDQPVGYPIDLRQDVRVKLILRVQIIDRGSHGRAANLSEYASGRIGLPDGSTRTRPVAGSPSHAQPVHESNGLDV